MVMSAYDKVGKAHVKSVEQLAKEKAEAEKAYLQRMAKERKAQTKAKKEAGSRQHPFKGLEAIIKGGT